MVDLGSLVLLMSIFGSEIAILYVLLGLLVAILGGAFIEKMHLEQQVEDIISQANCMAIHEVQCMLLQRKWHWLLARLFLVGKWVKQF